MNCIDFSSNKYAVVAIVASVIGYFVQIFAKLPFVRQKKKRLNYQDGEREVELQAEALRKHGKRFISPQMKEARERRNNFSSLKKADSEGRSAGPSSAMERREETLQRKFRGGAMK